MKVLAIGGGVTQVHFVRYLQSKGHYVAVVNPFPTATTQQANEHILLDVKDVAAIVQTVRGSGFQMVTSDQSDVCSLPVAMIAEALGLRGNPVDVIKIFTDKFLMNRHAQLAGLDVPAFDAIRTSADYWKFAAAHDYPFVIKPLDSTSSRGFGIVYEPREAEQKLAAAREWTKLDYILVQQFVPGTEVTVEGIASGWRHKVLTTSHKKHFRPGIASSLWYPSNLPLRVEAHNHFVTSANLEFGLTHAEYIFDGERQWFIECGARGGGAGIASDIIPLVTGINPYDILYESLLGNTVNVESLCPQQRPVVLYFLEFPAGKVVTMEAPVGVPGLHSFFFNFSPRQYLVPCTNDSTRHAAAILFAETQEQLLANVAQLNQSVKVVFDTSVSAP